ncbi:nuclear transport factor 2 family protein [Pseudolysinimonas yzui]|uniref:SnoaL-like domain-containing protein n=1 Tax=Pseudolysinimonas yzui TaxID=2708254 RepID=A0A8J3M044_9MICO|nr:nuclear transport factor 2 family protein [Pseudolysinimonas yzui]GHF12938.1 hypothetical protein GCM10011600_12160 [Pseudolysinimonas yzui]
MTTLEQNKAIATARLADYLERFPAEFVIAEGDLVTVVGFELRGADQHEFLTFHTFRIVDGEIVDEWSNASTGSAPAGSGAPDPARTPAAIGVGDPAANTQRVADFYRCVFEAQNADAVKDFVTVDYRQHTRHLPPGRSGLEGFVRAAFPDGPLPTPETASMPPAILMGEGDLVVIAGAMPQPDGKGGTYLRYLYDGYRVTDGMLAEHWSGVDPEDPPVH